MKNKGREIQQNEIVCLLLKLCNQIKESYIYIGSLTKIILFQKLKEYTTS